MYPVNIGRPWIVKGASHFGPSILVQLQHIQGTSRIGLSQHYVQWSFLLSPSMLVYTHDVQRCFNMVRLSLYYYGTTAVRQGQRSKFIS